MYAQDVHRVPSRGYILPHKVTLCEVLGGEAAIEAADVVLMDDQPSKVALAIRIARNTIAIARQNVVFAIAVKVAVLLLATIGIATMWLAVFADVGVTVLAVLNAMRALRTA